MPTHRYQNFDLQIEPAPEGYIAHVLSSPVGEVRANFTLTTGVAQPLSNGPTGAPSLMLAAPTALADEATAKGFGRGLFEAVFQAEVLANFRSSVVAAQNGGAGLRIRLRLNAVPALAALPWEYLFDPSNDRFLALSGGTPLVRYLELPNPTPVLPVSPPLRIAVLLADPAGSAARLQVDQEWTRIQAALKPLAERNALVVEQLAPATLSTLQRAVRQNTWHVLHFVGHGWFVEQQQMGGVLLEDAQGNADFVTASQLAVLLQGSSLLRLVFLNTCEAARADPSQPFAGVAQHLVRQGVPAVVAMQSAVSDQAASALSYEFYSALAEGFPLDSALAEARKAIYADGNQTEWATPVLFSRATDNQLVLLPPPEPVHAPRPRLDFEPETVPVPAGPFILGRPSGPGVPAEETDQHELNLPAFRIGCHPVTVRQYAEFVKQMRHPPPRNWGSSTPPRPLLDHPVVEVSWHDAKAYCAWLHRLTERRYRLPSEAEWEKAAHGVDGRLFPWGNEWNPAACHCVDDRTTAPVGSFPLGKSPFGCYDLLSNRWEWTATLWGKDWRKPDFVYPYDSNDGRQDEQADGSLLRVLRGGVVSGEPPAARCTARRGAYPDRKFFRHSFRVAISDNE